jgi:hypothetical protein
MKRLSNASGLIYCFDIDQTICESNPLNYSLATPIKDRIDAINALHDAGNTIIFNTARGAKSGLDLSDLTFQQLNSWNVRFHKLYMKKPFADLYVDDKGISDQDFFS